LKIKLNNVFKNIHINNDVTNTKRRKNVESVEKINIDVAENTQHIEKKEGYKRRGAANSKNIFNTLKLFKSKLVIKRSYYVLFVLMIVLATISVYTNIATYRKVNSESYAVFSNNDEKNEKSQTESSISENLQDLNSNNIDTRNSSKPGVSPSKVVVAAPATVKKTTVTIEPLNFIKPVDGEIVKVYSVDKLLFSKTLESWKIHDAVDIKSDLGTNVKSIEKGIVERIYEDSFLGFTIIIDHGQGYKSIYSNLDSNINVKEKQIIKKLTIIGKIGKSAIGEIKDEPHIHFMLMLNNKVIDPVSKIKF